MSKQPNYRTFLVELAKLTSDPAMKSDQLEQHVLLVQLIQLRKHTNPQTIQIVSKTKTALI